MSGKTILCSLAAAIALPYLAVGTITSTSEGWNSAHDLSSWSDSTAWHVDQEYVIPKGKTLLFGKDGVNDITFLGGPLTVGDASGGATFVLNGSDGKLHVSFDMENVPAGKSATVVVCTLPAAAVALGGDIVLDRPQGYDAYVVPTASSGAATDKIVVKLYPRGFQLIVR